MTLQTYTKLFLNNAHSDMMHNRNVLIPPSDGRYQTVIFSPSELVSTVELMTAHRIKFNKTSFWKQFQITHII